MVVSDFNELDNILSFP